MTFTEAALEVLRSAGEPLHYKKITEIAIEKNLLSHVGKTPEVTMSSRLATMAKKDRGTAPIIKVKPGVFALREGLVLPEDVTKFDADAAGAGAGEPEEEPAAVEAAAEDDEKEAPKLPGADVFPEEEGDDDPILAGLEEGDGEGDDKSRRRRRRRRRGGRAGEGEQEEEPQQPARTEGARRTGGRDRNERSDRNGTRDRGGRDRSRERTGARTRTREEPALDWNREPADNDLLGQDLADAAATVMAAGSPGELTFAAIAQLLIQRERLSGNAEQLAPTIAAALRADVASSVGVGRARFRISAGHVVLTDWLLGKESVRADETVVRAAERQRDQMRRALVGTIRSLPVAGFAELMATWLNREGVTALRAIRRPGGNTSTEFHFAGTIKRGPEEQRIAIVVYRAGADITREAVIEVRGALHHYGAASGAWLVSTGRVTSGAREEVSAEGAGPCALFGGQELAIAMERGGIGLLTRSVPISELDFGLFEALGADIQVRASAPSREGRDPERDQEREPEREGGRKRRRGRGRSSESDAGSEAQSTEKAEAASKETTAKDAKASEEAATAEAAVDASDGVDSADASGAVEGAAATDGATDGAADGAVEEETQAAADDAVEKPNDAEAGAADEGEKNDGDAPAQSDESSSDDD